MSKTAVMQTNDAGSGATDTVNQVIDSVHGVITRAAEAAGPALDSLTRGAHHTVDSLAGTAQRAAGRIDATSRQYRHAGEHFGAACSAHIRDKPISSLGIAAAVGFVIGCLFKLR